VPLSIDGFFLLYKHIMQLFGFFLGLVWCLSSVVVRGASRFVSKNEATLPRRGLALDFDMCKWLRFFTLLALSFML
jgi:hypothetical protein